MSAGQRWLFGRICFTCELPPGAGDKYDRLHADVRRELEEALKASGFANCSTFRRGRQVIAYAECRPDAATALRAIDGMDVNRRWGEALADLVPPAADGDAGRRLAREVLAP